MEVDETSQEDIEDTSLDPEMEDPEIDPEQDESDYPYPNYEPLEIDYDELAEAIYQKFAEAKAETETIVILPNGENLRVDHSTDLSSVLIAILLFTLVLIQSARWVVDYLTSRRG